MRTAAGECNVPLLSLFEQRTDGFVDITEDVGLVEQAGSQNGAYHAGGLSAADISGDGLPDIYFARWRTFPELYISDTLFIEGGEAPGYSRGSGLTNLADVDGGYWQGLKHDFDRDGLIDLFVNIDFDPNQLWINGEGLNLVEMAAEAGVDSAWNEMGLAAGDYDNDGDIDLAVTNGYCEIPIPGENRYCEEVHERDRSRFFENPGDGSGFVEVGALVGFDDTLIGAGLIAADFDGDGRQDLLQTAIDPDSVPWEDSNQIPRTERLTIYFNRPVGGASTAPFVEVRPRMEGPNTQALGAVVRVFMDNGETLTRLLTAGESWMSQRPATLHFGLGDSGLVERVEIDWPGDDADSVYESLPVNATSTLQGPETVFGAGFE